MIDIRRLAPLDIVFIAPKVVLAELTLGVLTLMTLTPAQSLGQQSNRPEAVDDSNRRAVAARKFSPAAPDPALSVPPDLSGVTLSQDQIKELVQKVADNDIENEKRQRNYTYIRREEEHRMNGKGGVQSTESRTFEVMILYGSHVSRLIAKNDKPLSERDTAKEEEKIQKIIEKRKNETEEQRKKRLDQEEKDREESRQWVREISDAYNFRMTGIENLDGRETYIFDGDPRPGFKPHLRDAKYLSKFCFRVWVDKAEMQWVKLDAQCIDTISWGLFLARLNKGAHILAEQSRVNDEVWLPKHEAVQLEARVALLKSFNINEDATYRDYKKFRTEAKIVGVEELQKQK